MNRHLRREFEEQMAGGIRRPGRSVRSITLKAKGIGAGYAIVRPMRQTRGASPTFVLRVVLVAACRVWRIYERGWSCGGSPFSDSSMTATQ